VEQPLERRKRSPPRDAGEPRPGLPQSREFVGNPNSGEAAALQPDAAQCGEQDRARANEEELASESELL